MPAASEAANVAGDAIGSALKPLVSEAIKTDTEQTEATDASAKSKADKPTPELKLESTLTTKAKPEMSNTNRGGIVNGLAGVAKGITKIGCSAAAQAEIEKLYAEVEEKLQAKANNFQDTINKLET
jgi:hypothetical protein